MIEILAVIDVVLGDIRLVVSNVRLAVIGVVLGDIRLVVSNVSLVS